MQSVSARQSAKGPVHWTLHVSKACYQGIEKNMSAWTLKPFLTGAQNKRKKEDGRDLFFGV